jgi:DNA-binding MarR family transcriptional regulator
MHYTGKISEPLALCLAVAKASAALSRRFDGRLGSFHGLSFSDFLLLLELSRAPGGRLRRVDLAARVGLTPSAVTRTLIPLEKIGLAARQTDPHDARAGYAVLTRSGQRVLREAWETAEAISREAVPEDAAGLPALSGVLSAVVGG